MLEVPSVEENDQWHRNSPPPFLPQALSSGRDQTAWECNLVPLLQKDGGHVLQPEKLEAGRSGLQSQPCGETQAILQLGPFVFSPVHRETGRGSV